MNLTLPQQDLYHEQMFHPNVPILNIGAKIKIKGKIDPDIMREAYKMLILQNDASRSVLNKENDIPVVFFEEEPDIFFEFVDYTEFGDGESKALDLMKTVFQIPFDLAGNELLNRMYLISVKGDLHYLLFVCHHLITDGWGTSLMYQRLVENYNQLYQTCTISPKVVFSYRDFVVDDKLYELSGDYTIDKKYWIERFRYLPENLFERVTSSECNKSVLRTVIIDRNLYNKLISLSKEFNVTTFHILLGVFFTYFGRKYKNEDFAIALPVLNRSKAKYKKTVGMFMGVNLLRMKFDFDDSFEDLVIAIKNQLRQDYRHQRFPLGKLINGLGFFNERAQLSNINFSYEKHDYSMDFFGTECEVIPLSNESERVALSIYVREFTENEDVKIDLNFHVDYFNDEMLNKILSQIEVLIQQVISSPRARLKDLQYISKEEKGRILEDFNNTKSDIPLNMTFIDYFLQQAESQNKIAIKDDIKYYTYKEADYFSGKVAKYILENYEENDTPIAVLLERSADLVIILLGILRAGRSYVPIDPNFPIERINYIVENSKAEFIITERNISILKDKYVSIDIEDIIHRKDDSNLVGGRHNQKKVAYILYTSGSTGKPKGVEVTHRSLLNFLLSMRKKPGISQDDIMFSVTTYSFDISILEFFLPLISGATLYVADQFTVTEPELTIRKIEQIKPTILQATPSFFQMLFNIGWKGDKKLKVLCGGDLISKALADKLIGSMLQSWNMYGPTETTIWSSIKKMTKAEDANNIGRPIDNTQIYILDEYMNILPVSEVGNVFIGGEGLAKGYYGNKELTDQKFIKNPFIEGKAMYNTGDLGEWTKDGCVIFHGRTDSQAKIRGYRIELEEIESYINKYLSIDNSVVLVKKDNNHEDLLVAYVPDIQRALNITEIRSYLELYLPYYMIPNRFIGIMNFPYTLNHKVDRKALSLMKLDELPLEEADRVSFTLTEHKLSKIWSEVLSVVQASIGSESNFFIMGGHSLTAVRICSMIQNEFSIQLSMRDIFKYPTLKMLAEKVDSSKKSVQEYIGKASVKEYYDLIPSQINIWLACQNSYYLSAYNMLGIYSVQGQLDIGHFKTCVNQLIQKYEILRTNIVKVEGKPVQKINLSQQINLETFDCENYIKDEWQSFVRRYSRYEFDFEKELLLKIVIAKRNDGRTYLLFLTHHIIMDGWSIGLFINEISELYSKKKSELDIINIQFKDYSEWFLSRLEQKYKENESFWKKYLYQFEKQKITSEESNSKGRVPIGERMVYELGDLQLIGLKDICSRYQSSLFSLLFSSFIILISKFFRLNDICLGTIFAGRNHYSLENQIGMFAKTLPVRLSINEKQKYIEFLRDVGLLLLTINDYQELPPQYSLTKLFDILFVFQGSDYLSQQDIEAGSLVLKTQNVEIEDVQARLPLTFNVYECSKILNFEIIFDINAFSPDLIDDLWQRFLVLIEQIRLNPEDNLEEYDLFFNGEKDGFDSNNFNFDF